MKKLFILFPFLPCVLQAQKYTEPNKMKQFAISINQEDQIVKTQILKDPKKINLDNNATYIWYTMNTLMETKGGYSGKLLHGYYKAFFLSNQLKEAGKIKYGLKSGEWRYWYSSGILREVITWKRGRKNGYYALYSDQGKIMAEGYFNNNLLHGNFRTYDYYGNVSEKKKYKNGTEVVITPKVKKEKSNERSTEEIKPRMDTLEKKNFFKRIFKKKKSESLLETKPTNITT